MKVKEITTALRRHGYKVTPQRRAILDVIARRDDHLTPAGIYEHVHETNSTVGLVTIYRTLEVLASLNLICRVHTEGNCSRYLIRRPAGHHHHVVCSSCGKVADVTGCDLGALEQRLSRETGIKIQSHLLEFEGLCRDCQHSPRVAASPDTNTVL
jgi:Fur family ferric uptake transcriptional regulator